MSTTRKIKKRAQSVLGLAVIDGQLRACHVEREKNGLAIVKTAGAALTLDFLHAEPELVGREIKNHLDAAGIREKNCVVGLPARWVMTQHTSVPKMSAEDTASFLQIEAEKGFPVDPAHLQIARSVQRSTAGEFVTQLAVRSEQIERLHTILKAAGLKPVSLTLGLAVLPGAIPPAGSGGRITVAVDPSGVTLLVSAGGGIASFRTFEAGIDSEAGEKIANSASIGRELRITFEQVPPELRSEVKELVLLGDAMMVRQLTESLGEWAGAAGLKLKRGDLPDKNFADELAEKLAGNWLQGGLPELELLPPRPSRWAVMMARYNSKRLATAGFGVAALAVIGVGAFGWHVYKRWSLQSQWDAMQAQVTRLDGVQAQIREFSPWYDTSFRTLSVLRRVTECFPENGTVTAKSIELHATSNLVVNIGGTVRDPAALLKMQEILRKAREVQGLQIEQITGKNPPQFNIKFRWNTGS